MNLHTIEEILAAIKGLLPADRARLIDQLPDSSRAIHRVEEPAAAYGRTPEYPYLSIDEYLEFEEQSQQRHEYVNGVIYAVSGPTEAHELIAGNLFAAIHAHVRGGPCLPFVGNFKLRLKIDREDLFYYPDVMVACTREGIEERYLRYPKLIAEVLSPSTESIDRREKFLNYAQIPSVEEYVVISQKDCKLAIHRREENWAPQWLAGPEAVLQMRSIALSLPLAQIYERVI